MAEDGNMALTRLGESIHSGNFVNSYNNIIVEHSIVNAPLAYLNILVFSNNMELIPASSRRIQVSGGSLNNWEAIRCYNCVSDDIAIDAVPDGGYVLVTINNNTIGKDVWFDDIDIIHQPSKVIEENHYYPFGLTISNVAAGSVEQPHKYQDKELEKSFGLEMFDFHARQYDPQLGRTWQIDPLANMFAPLSPYSWAANNPILFIDPTGMSIEPSSQKEWDKQKHNVMEKKDELQNKINKLNITAAEKGWSESKLANKIGNMQDRVNSLNETISNLSKLESSKQVYSLQSGAIEEGGTTYDPNTGNIVFSYGTTSNFIHETTHGVQFESGDIAFDKQTGKVYALDIFDEVDAYQAQFAYMPSSVSGLTSSSIANSFGTITPLWVQGITKSDGSRIYAPGGAANTAVAPVNINTTRDGLIKAYPHQKSLFLTLPASFKLEDIIPTIYKK